MKNVTGYDIARLLVGSKGCLAIVTQISFKVLPSAYVGDLPKPILFCVVRLNEEP